MASDEITFTVRETGVPGEYAFDIGERSYRVSCLSDRKAITLVDDLGERVTLDLPEPYCTREDMTIAIRDALFMLRSEKPAS